MSAPAIQGRLCTSLFLLGPAGALAFFFSKDPPATACLAVAARPPRPLHTLRGKSAARPPGTPLDPPLPAKRTNPLRLPPRTKQPLAIVNPANTCCENLSPEVPVGNSSAQSAHPKARQPSDRENLPSKMLTSNSDEIPAQLQANQTPGCADSPSKSATTTQMRILHDCERPGCLAG